MYGIFMEEAGPSPGSDPGPLMRVTSQTLDESNSLISTFKINERNKGTQIVIQVHRYMAIVSYEI